MSRTAETRYREAMRDTLVKIDAAYQASSWPAPHPVWWKRLLRRPYRRSDPAALFAAMRAIDRRSSRIPSP